jgi:hypothetical protein
VSPCWPAPLPALFLDQLLGVVEQLLGAILIQQRAVEPQHLVL